MTASQSAPPGRRLLDMNGYQWTVLFAAWLGWGFDVFDGLLFNFVAPNCVPTLLGLTIGSPEAKAATLQWTGILTSVLLVGWAVGGILFGQVADRIGRTRTLMLTMLLYALGTAACAFAPNIWVLMLFRIIASLGIGGEWAAGAAMVAEVVPEHAAGRGRGPALHLGAHGAVPRHLRQLPDRRRLLERLARGLLALRLPRRPDPGGGGVRRPPLRARSPSAGRRRPPPRRRRASPSCSRRSTGRSPSPGSSWPWSPSSCGGAATPSSPWSRRGLAQATAKLRSLDRTATLALVERWKRIATNYFNLGGLIGTLLTVPAAKYLGRQDDVRHLLRGLGGGDPRHLRPRPGAGDAARHVLPDRPDRVRRLRQLHLLPAGALPHPAAGHGRRASATTSAASSRPSARSWWGSIAAQGANSLTSALTALFYVGFVPLAGLLLLPWAIETKGRALESTDLTSLAPGRITSRRPQSALLEGSPRATRHPRSTQSRERRRCSIP